ncbi:CASP-like protein 5B3 [Cucurbita moschata]|uniref:CASP-like protein n=1 Tax=Cucurbita moschata TaxID=3662 RepID=A0A6J1E906_CUCMO|nr:CASP-like protein 5B3 [Cucurbita moschata]
MRRWVITGSDFENWRFLLNLGKKKMRDFPGSPGTVMGLILRILQFVFAAASVASMASTAYFFKFTAFCYLIASLGLQITWSFVLALIDAYALVKNKALQNSLLISLFVVGDWITATLTLAAASSSSGVAILYFNDLDICGFIGECQKYQLSVALAFLSWITVATSSLIMVWLLASS